MRIYERLQAAQANRQADRLLLRARRPGKRSDALATWALTSIDIRPVIGGVVLAILALIIIGATP